MKVVGCNQPVSAGRARGTSYVKKNAQIESVISALLTIEQNVGELDTYIVLLYEVL